MDAFIAAHSWFYTHLERDRDTASQVEHELNKRKTFELDGERTETTCISSHSYTALIAYGVLGCP
jgi:hypothetical protein